MVDPAILYSNRNIIIMDYFAIVLGYLAKVVKMRLKLDFSIGDKPK